ncbi:MAG: hypothetical protein ACE5HC_08820 [Candidatus Binatia bacterium]
MTSKNMKNDLQKLTDDVSRLFEETYQKTESLGQISTITRLYDELQGHLGEVSASEVDDLQEQIKATMEQMLSISKSLAMIKALKLMLNDQDESADSTKQAQTAHPQTKRSSEER